MPKYTSPIPIEGVSSTSPIESPPSSHTPDYSPPRTPEGVSSTSPIDSPPPHLLKKSIIKDNEYDEDENYNIGD
jgi:hypothetical protein